MKVLQTVVSTHGYRTPKGNKERLQLLTGLLAHARQTGCDLLLLPAGFLRARGQAEVALRLQEIAARARAAGTVGVIGGIDAGSPTKHDQERLLRIGGKLPFFGFAVEPGGRALAPWQQESITRAPGGTTTLATLGGRTVTIGGAKILALTCGEMYNQAMTALISPGVFDLVVESAHCDVRRQRSKTLRDLHQRSRSAVLLSQHVLGKGGTLSMVTKGGVPALSSIRSNLVTPLPVACPWVAAAVQIV